VCAAPALTACSDVHAVGRSTQVSRAVRSAQLSVTVAVRGAVTASGRFTQSADAASCASFARGVTAGEFTIPSGTSTASADGNPFALEAVIGGYRGPGRYGAQAFGDPTSAALTVDVLSSQSPFQPLAARAGESAVVEGDGSGSFTFSDWQDPGLRREEGSIVWTCS